jgi:hypothetical protein
MSASEVNASAVRSGPLVAVDASGTTTISRAQRLGDAHHARDESAARLEQSQQADAAHATAHSTNRWVSIVAAMRRQAEAYNTGARRVVLNVVEQSEERSVTIAAGGEGTPYLTATLEGTFICMKARDALGVPHATEFRLRSDRSDDATAAYLLQSWMERL